MHSSYQCVAHVSIYFNNTNNSDNNKNISDIIRYDII